MLIRRRRFVPLLAAAAVLATAAGLPASAAPTTPGIPARTVRGAVIDNTVVVLNLTREDTHSVDVLEGFTPPGYTPVIGDFVGGTTTAGKLDDIFWYTPGAGGDAIWLTSGTRSWSQTATSVSGTYTPIVGRFAADDKDDIFWYAPGSTVDYLWDFNNDGTITKSAMPISGVYKPVFGAFTNDGIDDIIWYAPGTASDSWWDFNEDGSVTQRAFDVKGTFTPVVGSFAGFASPTLDYVQDIVWYAPGTAGDALWDFNPEGTITKTSLSINGTYTPVPGNFSADGFFDIIWYAPGTTSDFMWNFTGAAGVHTTVPLTVNGTYTPMPVQLFSEEANETDILWFGKGYKPDAIWDFANTTAFTPRAISLNGDRLPAFATLERRLYAPEGGGTSYGIGADILDLYS